MRYGESRHKYLRTTLSFILAVCMICGMVPLNAYADESFVGEATGKPLAQGEEAPIPSENSLLMDASDESEEGNANREVDWASDDYFDLESDSDDSEEVAYGEQDSSTESVSVQNEADSSYGQADESAEADDLEVLNGEVAGEDQQTEEAIALDVADEYDEVEWGTYTIVFDANGGSGTMKNKIAGVDQENYLPECGFTRAGYDFACWSTKADGSGDNYFYYGDEFSADCSIWGDSSLEGKTITLYAQWTKPFTVMFNANGGIGTMEKMTAHVGETYNLWCEFTREGYECVEWNTKADGSGKSCSVELNTWTDLSLGGKTITLYAQWTLISYAVVFKANGGTGTMANSYHYEDEWFTNLPKATFKRTGYTFVGWNTKANGKGTSYDDKEYIEVHIGETLTLYARWSAITYRLTYKLNGGKNSSGNPKSYKVYSSTITLAKPTRKGYTFGGWFGDAKLTKRVKAIAKGSTGNKTLYAKWSINTYRIAYKLNGGKNSKKNPGTYTVTTAKITLAKPTRKGYTFGGWFSKAKFTKQVKAIAEGSAGNKTLYAKWVPIKYKLSYKFKGGKNSKKNPSTYTIESKKITLAKPTRKGYTFGGWFGDAKLTKRVKAIAKGSTGNKTLYAKWKPNKYTIVYDGNGATSGQMASQSGRVYGKAYKLKGNAFKREGKYFAGWSTKKNGKGMWYDNKEGVKNLTAKNNGKVVLYAQWEGGVGFTSWDADDGVVAIIRNHLKKNLVVTAQFHFYKGSTLVGTRSVTCNCLEKGGRCALKAWSGNAPYTSHKVQLTYEEAPRSAMSNASKISALARREGEGLRVVVKNNGAPTDGNHTTIAVVFYKNGRVVGYDLGNAYVDFRGATAGLYFGFPYASDGETITPTSYKLFVNESCRLSEAPVRFS